MQLSIILIAGCMVVLAFFVWALYRRMNIMDDNNQAALDRLTASVANIGREVSETATAIRDHVTSPAGISADALIGLADKLDAAASQLDSLQQTDQSGTAGGAPGGEPVTDQPGGEPVTDQPGGEPVTGGEPAGEPNAGEGAAGSGTGTDTGLGGPGSAAPADESGAGNQNGIGSEFETGDAGDRSGLGGSDAEGEGGQPA